jgi:replication factor C small subunit
MLGLEKLWVEKYRPKTLSECIFDNENTRQTFERFVENKDFGNLLLVGSAGLGKTTIARAFANDLKIDDNDIMFINGSDENNVDTMRDKIKNFITSHALSDFKLVIIDEADYLSHNAQASLRYMMEQYSDGVRFILTGNYDHKITPPIKSRCQTFKFRGCDKNDLTEKVVHILTTEKVKFKLSVLDDYVNVGYPDIRKIVNLISQNSTNSVLHPLSSTQNETVDYRVDMLQNIKSDNWDALISSVVQSVHDDEWEDVYRFLYENLHLSKQLKDQYKRAIVNIGEYLYKHSFVSDKEINFVACIYELQSIIGEK